MDAVARQFDVTAAEIEHWNGPAAAQWKPGLTLRIYPGGRPAGRAEARASKPLNTHALSGSAEAVSSGGAEAPAGGAVTHSVRTGETLWSIARAYHTTVAALRQANQFLSNRPLHVGDQLRILPGR